ncbi:glycine oxidase ThiO [Agarilytica rhodophyticola]|uniref:glycine oxidase ThiO n=1 Tax=Agarilytica rhodophyticola TaxID=1737490 RepID=UPI000B342D38|nr:glycine oxidase ThiO [Agarilytica rhodophyticola]
MKIGIVGAGIMGRLLAWQLAKHHYDISLFDKDNICQGENNGEAAAYTAAGMLTPFSEAESTEEEIVNMGRRSLLLWPRIVNALGNGVDFRQTGSIVLSHPQDYADLQNFIKHSTRLASTNSKKGNTIYQPLAASALRTLEPGLANNFEQAIFIASEAWLQPSLLLQKLIDSMLNMKVQFYNNCEVTHISSATITTKASSHHFDLVIDCRGLGAKKDLPQLRGVRGETICVHAPEVNIKHLIRLMHPRYRIYIVPRQNHHYLIGATQIENDYKGSITVRSALELLSAAYSVHSGFAEASIQYTRTNCRPALPDNLPQIDYSDGLMRINGLFRHGFLLAPALVEKATKIIEANAHFYQAAKTRASNL